MKFIFHMLFNMDIDFKVIVNRRPTKMISLGNGHVNKYYMLFY